jgi:hypothetical protein
MPHSLRYFPVALACSLAFNTHLISESHSAPRHQVPLSPAATPQPAPTHCAPAPFCRLFEPQSQPVSTATRAIKTLRKPAPGLLVKSKLKHPKTKPRATRHDPHVATTGHDIELPRRSASTAAIWGLAGYNYHWIILVTRTETGISSAGRASPYGTLTPLNDVAGASFQTRLGIPLNHVTDFGAPALTPGSFGMPPVLAPTH